MTTEARAPGEAGEPASRSQGDHVLGETESVCPTCLARIPAARVATGDEVRLRKACPAHGLFDTVIWRGLPRYETWTRPGLTPSLRPPATVVDHGCPFDCGLCPDHRQQSCCVLLEVTARCDVRCPYCFASAGEAGAAGAATDASVDELRARMCRLFEAAGPVNLQLSGGEPCVRNDLPAIARAAVEIGFGHLQVNTNGLRLARDPEYAAALREAGVATVFLQFDGTTDEVYRRTRGRPMLASKLAAIDVCERVGLGVVLVPVVIPGVNDGDLGNLLRFAISHQPTVRGLHLQPVSYFGRYPVAPTDRSRITLPEIMAGLAGQSDGLVQIENFQPGSAENPTCSFNGSFVSLPDGRLLPLTRFRPALEAAPGGCCGTPEPEPTAQDETGGEGCCGSPTPGAAVARAQRFVATSWSGAARPKGPGIGAGSTAPGHPLDELELFLTRSRTHRLAISGMAFQDAWTLDLARLRECHIHVAAATGGAIPFCAYNLTASDGTGPYRAAGR